MSDALMAEVFSLHHRVKELENENAELRRDAERYAYIRELDAGEISHLTHDLDGMRGEFLDARIDGILAAIRSAK